MSLTRVQQYWFDKWVNESECSSLSGDLGMDDLHAAFERGILCAEWLQLCNAAASAWPGSEAHTSQCEFASKHGFHLLCTLPPEGEQS